MIRVIGNRLLVALPPEPEELTSASGLVLVRDPDVMKTPTSGIVITLGEKTGTVSIDDVLCVLDELNEPTGAADVRSAMKQLAPAPFDVSVGDHVLFNRFVGDYVTIDGVQYVILSESDILGTVEKEVAA